MTRVVVAGVVSVRLAHAVGSFPVPYVSAQHCTGGLSMRLAGTGWTGATTLQALGSEVIFATYVGADALGTLAVQGLRGRDWYGPATLVCDEQPRSLVLYDRDGSRAGSTDLRSLHGLRYPPEVFDSLLDEPCDVAMLNSTAFTRSLIDVAVRRGVPIATDLHRIADICYPPKQDWMRAATVMSCSHENLPYGPREWIEAVWRRFGTPITLVGCGSDGALVGVRDGRAIWHVAGSTPRGVRYTSGAGDTLLAAFVHHHQALGDPVLAARHAVLAAGWKVGGSPDDEFRLSAADLAAIGEEHGKPAVRRLR